MDTARTAEGSGFQRVLRIFGSRNYRLFFGGQGLSLIGTWIQQIALSWMVYRLTGSPLMLGLVGFCGQIPTFLLGPVSGVLVDRLQRHRLLMVTQSLAMVQALLLSFVVLGGHVQIWQVLLLSGFLGIINAFDLPARQSFVVDVIEDRSHLPSAIALNSAMVNGARLIGPSVAGLLLAWVGEGWCFLLNGLSYVAVLVALASMRLTAREQERKSTNLLSEVRAGVTYAFGFPPIRAALLLLGLVSLVAMPYTLLMPVFATRILKGGPSTYGLLMTATGVGALAGALFLASRGSVAGIGRVILTGVTLFGASLIAFSLSRAVWLSLLLLPLSGFGMMVVMAGTNTFLQTVVDEDKRGRVMSLYTMAFMGMAPFGSLLAGSLADRIGAPATLLAGGACVLLAALVFSRKLPALREMVLPIYRRVGVIPEIARGVQAASELTRPPEKV